MDETESISSDSDVPENKHPINHVPINNSSNILYELMATPIKKTKQHTYESFPRIDEDCSDEDVVQTHDNFSSTFNSTLTSTFSVKSDDLFTSGKHSNVASKIMKKMEYNGKGVGIAENEFVESIRVGKWHGLGTLVPKRPGQRKTLCILSDYMLNQLEERKLSKKKSMSN